MAEDDQNGMGLAMQAVAKRLHEMLGLDEANPRWQDLDYMSPLDKIFHFIGGAMDEMQDDPRLLAVTARHFCRKVENITLQTPQEELVRTLHIFSGIILTLTDPIANARRKIERMRTLRPGPLTVKAVRRLAKKDGD